jgi:hypothetical protein
MSESKDKSWFKQHADTIAILSMFAICFWTLNEKMNDRFTALEKDICIIKTVLIMKNIMPTEMAACQKEEVKK